MAVTFWGRRADRETLDAMAFLKRERYGADRILDLDLAPPHGPEMDLLAKGLGGSLASAVRPHLAGTAPGGDGLPAWLAADAARWRAPLLLTPKGALAGFREQRWRSFLDIGKGR